MSLIILIAAVVVAIAACENSSTELAFPVMPKEMADCKIFRIYNTQGQGITIARCPNSTTTSNYTSGKSSKSTIIVDGIEYQKKDK